MAINEYDKVGAVVSEGRALEARALTRCAMALNDALTTADLATTENAVTMNQRLWLFFYSEIESKNVTLPDEVASNIISLVGYVVKVAPRAYSGERKVLETLIAINRNIAAGLAEGTGQAADHVRQPTAAPATTSAFSASV